MKLTKGRRATLAKTLAFCPRNFSPTENDIEGFFGHIDNGVRLDFRFPFRINGAVELYNAWNLWQSRKQTKTSLQQEMWLQGMSDPGCSLDDLAVSYLQDALYSNTPTATWTRSLPALQHLCGLRHPVGHQAPILSEE